MLIGVPKEIKVHEYRVGLLPGSVRELVAHGHRVMVENGAGSGAGFSDADYLAAGATLHASVADIYAQAAMIVKVKEPQPGERGEADQRPDALGRRLPPQGQGRGL